MSGDRETARRPPNGAGADETAGEGGAPPVTAIRSRADVAFGFATALAAVVFIVWAIPYSVQTPSSVEALPLSPAFLPYGLAACVGLLGLACGAQAAFGRGVPAEPDARLDLAPRWGIRLAAIALIFALYYALAERLGMLPLAVVVMGAMLWMGGERSLLRGALLSVALPLGVYLFFTRVAQVPLPEGVLEGWP